MQVLSLYPFVPWHLAPYCCLGWVGSFFMNSVCFVKGSLSLPNSHFQWLLVLCVGLQKSPKTLHIIADRFSVHGSTTRTSSFEK